MISWSALAGALLTSISLMGCGSSAASSPSTPSTPPPTCRDGVTGDVRNGARVAGQGIEEGAEVGVAGVKQAVGAAGGFIADGKDGAEQRWNEGKAETKQETAEGRQERHAANLPPCP